MQYFLRKAQADTKKVTVIFLGWACEYNQFARLLSNTDFKACDILFVWDYRDFEFAYDLSKYDDVNVLAFSYGIFAASQVKFKNLKSAIAINGTPHPISKEFGIPPKIFDLTLKNVSKEALTKFYRNMFSSLDDADKFLATIEDLSEEKLAELKAELDNIQKETLLEKEPQTQFTRTYISRQDRIFPPKAQYNYWNNCAEIIDLETGHFPFFKHSLEEFLK